MLGFFVGVPRVELGTSSLPACRQAG